MVFLLAVSSAEIGGGSDADFVPSVAAAVVIGSADRASASIVAGGVQVTALFADVVGAWVSGGFGFATG